jgi:hypothetical protein
MVLDKPKGEECGNCRFCTSFMMTETKYKNKGFLQCVEEKVIVDECFQCRRSPPRAGWVGDGSQIIRVDPSLCRVNVPKDHWCGEWKKRDE